MRHLIGNETANQILKGIHGRSMYSIKGRTAIIKSIDSDCDSKEQLVQSQELLFQFKHHSAAFIMIIEL